MNSGKWRNYRLVLEKKDTEFKKQVVSSKHRPNWFNRLNTNDDWAVKRMVHPAIEPLSYLIGTWRGEGEGGFPTISSFAYGEELNFTHPGNKPVIAYSQKTWKLNSGEPMHAESGYWRPKPDGTIEVVIAQSTGLVEVQKGTYDAEKKVVKLQSELVGNALKVKEITRVFTLVNEELSYVVEMATNITDLQPHLKASLKKL